MSSVPGFLPSTSAPLFGNSPWPPGLDLSISIDGLPSFSLDATAMGLCGGMVFTARDIFQAKKPQLRSGNSVGLPMPTAQYLLNRQVDSLSPMVTTWLHKTEELDHSTVLGGQGLFAETIGEATKVMQTIDRGVLCPIGVVLTQSWSPLAIGDNHCELVFGYDLVGSKLTLHTYDPNFPAEDSLTISLDISRTTPAGVISTNGTSNRSRRDTVRGFFVLDYSPHDPSPAYVDDGVITGVTGIPSPMTPGQTARIQISMTNLGSTTWDPAVGYKLGTQSPQDNTEWGVGRFALPGVMRPEERGIITATITAPKAAGFYTFQVQPLQEMVRWFGRAGAPVRVAVGSITGACVPGQAQLRTLLAQLADVEAQIAGIDWSDPVIAKREAGILAARLSALSGQVNRLEQQLIAAGCAPG
jgi:hypothetical protein